MSLFKNMLNSEESLFKNELALDFSFQPKPMRYRETQQRYMANCIKPLFQNRNGKNLLIYGVPGIGKTLACKQVIEELWEETEDIVPIYINCWHKNTTFKIFLELCVALDYKMTQNKGSDELFKIIKERLNKKSAVFIFDEIDKVEDFDFLYSILEEVYRKSIFLITNYKDWASKMEERIRSRLFLDNLEFKAYNYKETEGILKQRVDYAFVPGVLDEGAFSFILKRTVELQDIRAGLSLLREAGLNAENRSSKNISVEDANKASEKLEGYSIQGSDVLADDSRLILNLVKKNDNIKMGDLYKLYEERGGRSAYRSFFRRVKKLAEDRFITLDKKEGGAEGRTTIVNYCNVKKLSDF
jgi:cell division control protein 6